MTHPTMPNDGRYLNEEEEVPFFSMKLRMINFFDAIAAIMIFLGCTAFYQSYISGNYGVMAERMISEERDLLLGQKSALSQRIKAQENLNLRLSDTFLDLDLLEERSRILLGYTHPKDVVIKN